MYVVARHTIGDPATAFARGERLISGEGAPPGVRPLQFYPSEDRLAGDLPGRGGRGRHGAAWVDDTLGDASVNDCHGVDADLAFAKRPLGLPAEPAARAGY